MFAHELLQDSFYIRVHEVREHGTGVLDRGTHKTEVNIFLVKLSKRFITALR